MVAAQTPALKNKNGSFSKTNLRTLIAFAKNKPSAFGACTSPLAILPRGQKSSSNITNGSVTTIGLLIRPRAKHPRDAAYALCPARLEGAGEILTRAHAPYASKVKKQKNALSTSFRSATQATDSTWSGCQANKAATITLGQPCFVN
jgi:hypothetical protein